MNSLDHSTLLSNATEYLRLSGIEHGHLDVVSTLASRNLFVTDHHSVFVKHHPTAPYHEHQVASHLSAEGFPTPEPLAHPVGVPSGFLLAYRYHEEAPGSLQVTDVARILGRLWRTPAPGISPHHNWRSMVQPSMARLDALPGETAKPRLAGIMFNVVNTIAEATREREPDRVFTHGDLHQRNVHRGPDGRLMLVDWENAGLWWPEMEVSKFLQAGLSEPDSHHSPLEPGEVTEFLTEVELALGRHLDPLLVDACTRLRAVNAAIYQVTYGLDQVLPQWFDACVDLATDGIAALV